MDTQEKRKLLISLLYNTGRTMRGYFHENKESACPLLHMETLRFIKETKNPSMKTISEHLCITPASTSNLIDGLVESGFLKRTFIKNDRRIIRLKITEKGLVFLKSGQEKANEKMNEIFSELTEEELDSFSKLLNKFIGIVNNKKIIN